jgi:predicted acetyltransferase
MSEVYLIKPNIRFEEEYLDMIHEWEKSDEKFTPWVLNFDTSDFAAMVEKLEELSRGIGVSPNSVESSTYWLVDENNRVLGAANLRHRLNESLADRGGHIGYGIRPSERKKGYATEILRQALDIMKDLNINKVLITCDKENIGSAKTIIKNGGILESEGVSDESVFQRYWIDME